MTVIAFVHGGQAGTDRGAVEAAKILGIKCSGWAPRGWRSEDGTIPPAFREGMTEAATSSYPARTLLNVHLADAVFVVTRTSTLTPGSGLTVALAAQHGKPCFTAALSLGTPALVIQIRYWLAEHKPKILMVGGSRESKAPGIQRATCELLLEVFRG